MTHHVAVSGTVPKFVRCEGCKADYVYLASRVGSGSGQNMLFIMGEAATREATQEAEEKLRNELYEAVDPIPCPHCGHFQQAMIKPAQSCYLRQWTGRGLWTSGWSIPVMMLSYSIRKNFSDNIFWFTLFWLSVAAFFTGVIIVITRMVLVARFEPNKLSADHRLAIGRQFAIPRAEYEALAQERKDCSESSNPSTAA